MSILVLTSDTLIATAAAGNIEYNGQFFATDSAASRAQVQRITQGTAVASTSGTSIDFTSLPAWVKRITVMFSGVSLSGTSSIYVQIGSGSAEITGYAGVTYYNSGAGTTFQPLSAAFWIRLDAPSSAAALLYGNIVLTNISGNIWTGVVNANSSGGTTMAYGCTGTKTTSGVLDRVRITTANGTDTFDAGTINILYEG
jgi:hypothetical protein